MKMVWSKTGYSLVSFCSPTGSRFRPGRPGRKTYHDTRTDRDPSTAVGVGNDVTEADTQERDRDEPHRVQQVGVLFIVEPDWFRAWRHSRVVDRLRAVLSRGGAWWEQDGKVCFVSSVSVIAPSCAKRMLLFMLTTRHASQQRRGHLNLLAGLGLLFIHRPFIPPNTRLIYGVSIPISWLADHGIGGQIASLQEKFETIQTEILQISNEAGISLALRAGKVRRGTLVGATNETRLNFAPLRTTTYHGADSEGDASAAVRVRDNVSIPYAQKGDGYQPHGV